MSKQSLINVSLVLTRSETPLPISLSLGQLFDLLGFDPWITMTATFVIPAISLIGIILKTSCTWIFFREKFKNPVFFYYRLLCLVYAIHLAYTIPFGLLVSPQYFPQINTYLSSFYLIYYLDILCFLFHFEETLQMAILLTRMKIISPFVNTLFSFKPWVISLTFFLIFFFTDIFAVFALKVDSFGTYSYYDSLNDLKQNGTFYYFTPSDFTTNLFGRIVFGITILVVNLFLSIIVGITFNGASVHLYRSYVKERRKKVEAYNNTQVAYTSNLNQAWTSIDTEIQVFVMPQALEKGLTQKEINEYKAEKNMFLIALTLSMMSIVSRVILICVTIYFLILFLAFSF